MLPSKEIVNTQATHKRAHQHQETGHENMPVIHSRDSGQAAADGKEEQHKNAHVDVVQQRVLQAKCAQIKAQVQEGRGHLTHLHARSSG